MTDNIIQFPRPDSDSESFNYIVHQESDHTKVLGVIGLFSAKGSKKSIQLIKSDSNERFMFEINNEHVSGTRKELAQFLWAAAYFLDSDGEFMVDKYMGLDK